jgi:serine/threonine protein kinase
VTDAVGYAHLRGVVHSDIAPWNILYRESDDLYLLADFGLLKVVERDLLSVPSRSVLVGGRAAFLPPYARNNLDRVSPATDTYALAITFWNLLAGRAVLKHEESVPGVISIAAEQRDAPPEVRQLLVRFVEEHTPDDNVADFVAALLRIPVR